MSRRAGAGIYWTTCVCPGRSPRGETSPARRSSPTVERPWCGCVAATRRTRPDRMPSDRALQDDVIRALADAPYRGSADWRRRELADPDRVERHARFLARHFYYERIVHFFKYSRALARVTGRAPEAILKGPAFDALLPTLVLGSRETAAAVGRLVTAYVAAGRMAIPYLADLLRYEEAMMEVQIFGVRKSAATRAALRFFAERRIKTHFVDLNERAASPGELRRFAQKFGVQALIDRDARRLIELGLKSALLSDDRWLEKLTLEPLLLRMPLVRHQQQLTVGPAEETWEAWVASARASA